MIKPPDKTDEELKKVFAEIAVVLYRNKVNSKGTRIIAATLNILGEKLKLVEEGKLTEKDILEGANG